MFIECKTYSSNAHIPKKPYLDSAGYDLWVAETKVLLMAIPNVYYGRIVGCSALANTHSIVVHNGTIDSDYRGKVCVVLVKLSNEEYVVKTGNCIAQMITEHCFTPKFVEVSEFTEKKTERGQKGFDSSSVYFFLPFKKLINYYKKGIDIPKFLCLSRNFIQI